ncbi:MAG: hypothetical protein Q9200_006699 [Gallowayella weberi]
MTGQSKKSTKKFEKNHLKDTLGKRKEFAKIKQRHLQKAKKKARNAKDSAPENHDKTTADREAPFPNQTTKLNGMDDDPFFQDGLQLPEPKKAKQAVKNKTSAPSIGKRKRGFDASASTESRSSSEVEDQVFTDQESASEEDGEENHQEDLDALATKDPDFYKYLQENDAELLDFGGGDLTEVDQLSEDEKPKKKQKTSKQQRDDNTQEDGLGYDVEDTTGQVEVTLAMLSQWKTAMADQNSLRAMRRVVLAFRAAAYVNADDDKELKYSISSPDVYHQLLVSALDQVPSVLNHHVPVKESTTGKARVATDSKKYRTLTPLLRSHATAVIHLLENLSDAPTIKKTLNALVPLLPYLLPFKKILKSLVTSVIDIWSDSLAVDTTRITAFLVIRRLAIVSDASIRTALLKTTYQGLVKGSRVTNSHTLPPINLMKNSAAELWGIDPEVGYTTGFVYIRQLAVHLRSSVTQPTKDSYKQIYNWQYIHSLDFWSRVIATHCSPASNPSLKASLDSSLHPLLYPLVQITLGALRLIPTAVYYPLRFQLTRSLLRISRATNTYIPLTPSLLEILQSAEMTKPPKPSTLKALDFATILRVPKPYLGTRTYQDGLGEQVVDLMAESFGIWAKHIAFPELMLAPTVHMKRWLKTVGSSPKSRMSNGVKASSDKAKGNKNSRVTASVALLVQKLESNARWIEDKRSHVDFGPSNREGVEGFLRDVAIDDTPLGAYVEGLRRKGEEKERMLERAREAEKRDRAKDKNEAGETESDSGEADQLEDELDE